MTPHHRRHDLAALTGRSDAARGSPYGRPLRVLLVARSREDFVRGHAPAFIPRRDLLHPVETTTDWPMSRCRGPGDDTPIYEYPHGVIGQLADRYLGDSTGSAFRPIILSICALPGGRAGSLGVPDFAVRAIGNHSRHGSNVRARSGLPRSGKGRQAHGSKGQGLKQEPVTQADWNVQVGGHGALRVEALRDDAPQDHVQAG